MIVILFFDIIEYYSDEFSTGWEHNNIIWKVFSNRGIISVALTVGVSSYLIEKLSSIRHEM